MRFGLFGSMGVLPGHLDEVVAILLRDVEELRSVGCELYVVHVSEARPDTVFVTEVWGSSEDHQRSLQLPTVKAAITEAMPLLTGMFEQVELSTVGGLGLGSPSAGSPSAGSASAGSPSA